VAILFSKRINKPRQILLATLIVVIVATICYFLTGIAGYRVIALILLMVVSLIAMFFDILPVLLAAVLSALIWDYFFIPPRFTFRIGNAEDSLLLLMYIVIAMVNAVLTYKIRQVEKEARLKEEKANAIKLYNILLNSLSHELKTPIATIIGASDNLLTDANKISDANKHQLISDISLASLRLNQQVENLLNMSRIESGYIQPKKDWCDVNELIYGVVNRLEDKLKDHHLLIDLYEKLPLFKLDFGLMDQVLSNLLNNAIIYTPAGTVIKINVHYSKELTGHFTKEHDNLITNTDTELHKLIFVIEDNGPGFPPAEISRVFDKFYRLKNSKTGGTGLGLSIVKGLVEAHQGTIDLWNMPKGGARFTIEIPAEASYLNNLKNE